MVRELCTSNKKGRFIERSEYAEYVEQNRKNIEADKAVYSGQSDPHSGQSDPPKSRRHPEGHFANKKQ
jgi:hypothetical protein